MSFPVTTADDLRAHLQALGIQRGDHLTVHARLLSFGLIKGGIATVFDAIKDAVGSEGTIVVPSYTLSRGTVYDPRTTPSQGVGPLPEYIRTLPGAVRSSCPMHNHVGLGSRLGVLMASDGEVSFGPGSDFESFLDADFRLLLLGVRLNEAATFIHHIEAMAKVPYRTWMDFSREYVEPHGEIRIRTCRYYGRTDCSVDDVDFDILEPILIQAGVLTRVKTHFGASRLVALRDLFHHGMAALARDPYSLVKIK
jgi:aminoglycoside 3-N-acetyltransferase